MKLVHRSTGLDLREMGPWQGEMGRGRGCRRAEISKDSFRVQGFGKKG